MSAAEEKSKRLPEAMQEGSVKHDGASRGVASDLDGGALAPLIPPVENKTPALSEKGANLASDDSDSKSDTLSEKSTARQGYRKRATRHVQDDVAESPTQQLSNLSKDILMQAKDGIKRAFGRQRSQSVSYDHKSFRDFLNNEQITTGTAVADSEKPAPNPVRAMTVSAVSSHHASQSPANAKARGEPDVTYKNTSRSTRRQEREEAYYGGNSSTSPSAEKKTRWEMKEDNYI